MHFNERERMKKGNGNGFLRLVTTTKRAGGTQKVEEGSG